MVLKGFEWKFDLGLKLSEREVEYGHRHLSVLTKGSDGVAMVVTESEKVRSIAHDIIIEFVYILY